MEAGRGDLGVSWWVLTPCHGPLRRCCRAACVGHRGRKTLLRALVVAWAWQVEAVADKTCSRQSL